MLEHIKMCSVYACVNQQDGQTEKKKRNGEGESGREEDKEDEAGEGAIVKQISKSGPGRRRHQFCLSWNSCLCIAWNPRWLSLTST